MPMSHDVLQDIWATGGWFCKIFLTACFFTVHLTVLWQPSSGLQQQQ
jgi:hypothetical protein